MEHESQNQLKLPSLEVLREISYKANSYFRNRFLRVPGGIRARQKAQLLGI